MRLCHSNRVHDEQALADVADEASSLSPSPHFVSWVLQFSLHLKGQTTLIALGLRDINAMIWMLLFIIRKVLQAVISLKGILLLL